MHWLRTTLIAVAVLALVLAVVPPPPDRAGAAGDRPVVLTTFTVIADMVEQVAGDRVRVESIVKPGAEIHGYEPTPSDLRRAAGADLVFDNGMGLERWFDQFIDRAGADRVTLSDGIDAIPIAGDSSYAGKPNPHAWMSVDNARVYVENIRRGLTRLDPEGAAAYEANARRYLARLERIGDDVRDVLDGVPERRRALVTCEGAFSYLARDLGLREHYLWPVNAEQEGTPQQVASVVDAVRETGVPGVFCESTVSPKAQQQVAAESGARFAGTLYVDSLSGPGGPVPDYETLLRRDVQTIVEGLR